MVALSKKKYLESTAIALHFFIRISIFDEATIIQDGINVAASLASHILLSSASQIWLSSVSSTAS